ncbi:MAG: ATP-binding protein [Deltaproteobacteria bacterium]|nr:ATP-binding protein [Deltaproteobacteria bacterium]
MDLGLKIKLPAKIENLRRFIDFVSDYAKQNQFSDERIKEIELATEEALVNISKYAYPNDIGDIELRCQMQDNNILVIEIIDNGIPFDMNSVSEPDLNSSILNRNVGGLGIHLIKKMVDKINYKREKDKNHLIFLFYK